MVFSTLIIVYSHHLCLVPEYCYYLKGDPVPTRQSFHSSLFPAPSNHNFTFCFYEFDCFGYLRFIPFWNV